MRARVFFRRVILKGWLSFSPGLAQLRLPRVGLKTEPTLKGLNRFLRCALSCPFWVARSVVRKWVWKTAELILRQAQDDGNFFAEALS